MYEDDILKQVRAAREAYGRRFNFDLDAILADLGRQTKEDGRPVVNLSSRRPVEIDPAAVETISPETPEKP